MTNSPQLEAKLGALQTWVTAGIGFIVVFAVSVMAALVWFAAVQSGQRSDLADVAVETHTALCSLRADLQVRYDANARLLKEHPGDPVRAYNLVIPRATLKSSVASQKATLDALGSLNCPER